MIDVILLNKRKVKTKVRVTHMSADEIYYYFEVKLLVLVGVLGISEPVEERLPLPAVI